MCILVWHTRIIHTHMNTHGGEVEEGPPPGVLYFKSPAAGPYSGFGMFWALGLSSYLGLIREYSPGMGFRFRSLPWVEICGTLSVYISTRQKVNLFSWRRS